MTYRALNRRDLASLLGVGALMPMRAWAEPLDEFDERFTLSMPQADAPYKPPTDIQTVADLYKRMTAEVRVNGQGPYAFVVDTGSNRSVIAQSLVDELGLAIGSVEPMNGAAGVQMTATTMAKLQIGSKGQIQNVTLSILPDEAIGGLGMLGLDRLEGQQLTLDFGAQRLHIDPTRLTVRDPGDITMRARMRDGQLTLVDADVAGIPVTAFLDSGAQNTIGNEALKALAVERNPKSVWGTVQILSATGQTIQAEMTELPGLRVGGLRLPNWPVAFADLHTFKLWGLTEKPAVLLGVDVLSRFQRVSLDFAHGEVRFRLPESS